MSQDCTYRFSTVRTDGKTTETDLVGFDAEYCADLLMKTAMENKRIAFARITVICKVAHGPDWMDVRRQYVAVPTE